MKKRTLKNLRAVVVAQMLALGFSQLGLLILAGILPPTDFGIYAAIMVVYNLAIVISTLGVDQAAIQSKDETDAAIGTGATIRILVTVVSGVVMVLIATPVASFFGNPEIANPLRIMSIVLVVSSLGFVSTIRMTRELRFVELSISRVAYALIWPSVAVVAAVLGLSYWSFVAGFLLGNLVTLVILLHFSPWNFKLKPDRGVGRRLLMFGRFTVATSLVVYMVFNLDKVVIGRIVGGDELGVYFLAFSFGTIIPTMFTNVVNSVMFPTYARISEDRALLKEAYRRTLVYLAYVSMPMGVGLAAISSTFVDSILGPEWVGAAVPLAVLSFVGLASSMTSPAGSLFLAMGKPEIAWRISIILLIPYLVLLVPAAAFFGIVGVSILMLAQTMISLIWVLIVASKLTDVGSGTIFRDLLRPTAPAAIMGMCILAASMVLPPTIPSLAGLVGLGILIYAAGAHFASHGTIIREFASMIRP